MIKEILKCLVTKINLYICSLEYIWDKMCRNKNACKYKLNKRFVIQQVIWLGFEPRTPTLKV